MVQETEYEFNDSLTRSNVNDEFYEAKKNIED